MNLAKVWRGLALLTAMLYAGLAWLWYAELISVTGGALPFDGRHFGYSVDEARAYLDVLPQTAREAYLGSIRTLDTVFPISLCCLLAAPIFVMGSGLWRLLMILPLAYLGVDFWENAQVATLLRADVPSDDMIRLASRLTVTKFALIALSVIALAGVFVTRRRP